MVNGIISKKASSGKIKNGFVQTPSYVTNELLNNEVFEGNILEPCCGKGAISEEFRKKGYNITSSDLIDYGYGEIKDLFQITDNYDNIVTNPPFALKIDMIEHLLRLTNKKLVLLWYTKNIGNLIESKRSIGLKNIYVFKKRIEWKETKIGWLFAWYVWEKGYEGDVKIRYIK